MNTDELAKEKCPRLGDEVHYSQKILVTDPEPCQVCQGTHLHYPGLSEKCPQCKGSPYKVFPTVFDTTIMEERHSVLTTCGPCNGYGRVPKRDAEMVRALLEIFKEVSAREGWMLAYDGSVWTVEKPIPGLLLHGKDGRPEPVLDYDTMAQGDTLQECLAEAISKEKEVSSDRL